jgi:ubiquinone/menaquinone biosynthesis C-methylase UbiE
VPEMSRLERAFCQSPPWRVFASRVVLPWALQGVRLEGEVLEIGAGGGAMAERIADAFPDVRLTVTDFDPAMVAAAEDRLERFGDRVRTVQSDATALEFGDGSFDSVLSFIMLHHVIEWEQALAEAVRVLKPGGHLIGYDLVASRPARWLHQVQREHHRLIDPGEFRRVVGEELSIEDVGMRPALGGLAIRFRASRAAPY